MDLSSRIISAILLLFASTCVVAHPTESNRTSETNKSYTTSYTRKALDSIRNCLAQNEIRGCLTSYMVHSIDDAIKDNGTWEISNYMFVEKDENWKPHQSKTLVGKIKDLAESRSIRVRLSPLLKAEGRKKKDKDKGGYAMMGGMALIGMVMQMFMSKVAMLAGVAFVLSKIALIVSLLKKSHGTEHVVTYESSGHGSGWQRNAPRYVAAAAADQTYSGHYPETEAYYTQ